MQSLQPDITPHAQPRSLRQLLAPRSLRQKLIYSFLAVAVISVGIVTIANNIVLNKSLYEGNSLQISNTAHASALTLGDLLGQEIATLQAFSVNKVVRDTVARANDTYSSNPEIRQQRIQEIDTIWRTSPSSNPVIRTRLNNLVATELRAYQETFPDNAEVFVTDAYGAIVATTNPTSDYAQADEAWWQAAWNGGKGDVYISQGAEDASSDTFGLIIAVPLYDENTDAVIGVLRATYRLTSVLRRMQETSLGKTGGLVVVLPNNEYLPSAAKTAQFSAQEAAALATANNEAITTPLFGVERLISLAPVTASQNLPVVGALGWKVLAYQDTAEVFDVVRGISTVLAMLGLGTLLLASVFAFVFAGQLTKSIQQLSLAARRIGEGAFDQRITLQNRDEIGHLAHQFNLMANTVEQHTQALEAQIQKAEAARAEAERAHAESAAHLSTIEQQQAVIREMSVPVLPVSETALVMPLVGALDSARMQHMQSYALRMIEEHNDARHLIVDVTGVPIIDTFVASRLLELIRGARLLGTEVVIVGIRPEVAQTLVGLGVPLDMIKSLGTLQEGIAYTMGLSLARR